MSSLHHNGPPFAVLELDEHELKYLMTMLGMAHEQADGMFKYACEMPSSNPQALHRSTLIFTSTTDRVVTERLLERLRVAGST